jgi:hypothetical protein
MSSLLPLRQMASRYAGSSTGSSTGSTLGETLFWTAAQAIFEHATGKPVHTAPTGLVATGPRAGAKITSAQKGEMVVGLGAAAASILTDPKIRSAFAPAASPSSLSSSFSIPTNSNSLFNQVGSSSGSGASFLPPKPGVPLITFTQLLAQTGVNLHGSAAPINYLAQNSIFQQAIQAKSPVVLKDKATNEEATVLDSYVGGHMRMIEFTKINAPLK